MGRHETVIMMSGCKTNQLFSAYIGVRDESTLLRASRFAHGFGETVRPCFSALRVRNGSAGVIRDATPTTNTLKLLEVIFGIFFY
jgi:hypothetical protein